MLLKQLIQQPMTSSRLLVLDPFHMPGEKELVKEVIGLANADVEGPRHILFGVNPAAMDGKKIVGIGDETAADLKKAHRYISELIEPVVSLAFIFDRFNGKLVGALEVDDHGEGPFVARHDFSKELPSGKTWKRDGRELCEVDIADLAREVAPEATQVIDEAELIDPLATASIEVGFNDDPESSYIELSIPDTSDPPFPKESQGADDSRDLGETIRKTLNKTVNTIATRGLRFGKRSSAGPDPDDSTDVVKAAQELLGEVQDHYYYEEKALQLNFVTRNTGLHNIKDVSIELGFPIFDGFDIADRIYTNPFDKRSAARASNSGYPKIEKQDRAIFVRSPVGVLEPNIPVPALKCPLRMAVGPAAQKKKLAVQYVLRQQDRVIGQGRLKIRFGKVAA